MLAALLGQLHDVRVQRLVAVHVRQLRLQTQDQVGVEQRLHVRRRLAVQLQQVHLVFEPGVAHFDAEEEAVELGLRKAVHALLLHRVLRGEHEEGPCEQ